jgi:hypothetical protein
MCRLIPLLLVAALTGCAWQSHCPARRVEPGAVWFDYDRAGGWLHLKDDGTAERLKDSGTLEQSLRGIGVGSSPHESQSSISSVDVGSLGRLGFEGSAMGTLPEQRPGSVPSP